MWEVVEACTREVGIGETEGRRDKGGSREEKGRKGEEEETKKGKTNGGEESSRGMGDMG